MKRFSWTLLLPVILLIIHHHSSVVAFVVVPVGRNNPSASITRCKASVSDCDEIIINENVQKKQFDLATALFCGGLAFDAYTIPPSNSSRWEKGSKGMNVAFVSANYTRNLYKGLVQVQPMLITDLPDEDDAAEGLLSGGGVDAYLLVAAVEGQWKEDVDLLERQTYHDGVMGLMGAAHVGRSRTAWANVNEAKSIMSKRARGVATPHHVKSTWGKGGQANYTNDEPPFYLYLQDPATARLVFTVMDADKVGEDTPIGSAHRRLVELIPGARLSGKDFVHQFKDEVLEKLRQGNIDNIDMGKSTFNVKFGPKGWTGDIKLTSKPEIKDKKGQIATGAAAGAMVAGPVGAMVGGLLANAYEGQIRGRIQLRLRYLPFPPIDVARQIYDVKGGLPGVDWGELYEKYLTKTAGVQKDDQSMAAAHVAGKDLEHCFFINHDETGSSCALYRSLEKRLIVVSFRGTCEPKDILTDASLIQQAWIEGEDMKNPEVARVHLGFRNSLSSISRRLKELLLAAVAPGEEMSQYDVLVTGHSLGGALATLFVADIADYGIDAGRALPQMEPSEPWWSSIASTFGGKTPKSVDSAPPPRPKSLRLYNFGSPRVGNDAFCERFATLQKEGKIDEAYRLVNGEDVVARNPRTIIVPAVGNIGYDHCGATVLISPPESSDTDEGDAKPILWVEGESDRENCPVRDSVNAIESPLSKGSLLGDLYDATQKSLGSAGDDEEGSSVFSFASKLGNAAEEVANRLGKVSATDIASVVGLSREFTDREFRLVQSLFNGEAIKHHMEDTYYEGMGRAAGFVARVGEEIEEARTLEANQEETVEEPSTQEMNITAA